MSFLLCKIHQFTQMEKDRYNVKGVVECREGDALHTSYSYKEYMKVELLREQCENKFSHATLCKAQSLQLWEGQG